MLCSIALAPGLLNPHAAHPPDRIAPLTGVLKAIAENGVIIAPEAQELKRSLGRAAEGAADVGAQRLQELATSIALDVKRYCAIPPSSAISRLGELGALERCIAAARWGRCDAVLVGDPAESQACLDAGVTPDRVIRIEDFAESQIEQRRASWRDTQRLDSLPTDDAIALVGGAVRYSKKLVVADKMIGASIKSRDGQKDTAFHRARRVGTHLAGAAYFLDVWHATSPLATGFLPELEIVTVAGGSAARGGAIDPTQLRTAIETAAKDLGISGRISALSITLKQDGAPPIFNDRLLACGRRAWGLQHGLDDFGRLRQPEDRRPTMIDPASEARASVLRDILALRTIK